MSSIDLENADPLSRRADPFNLGIERARLDEENPFATDHYELLRIAPQADVDTIERVYRTLADRFHPDNPVTGDAETFLRLKEAYETLSDQDNREKYNVLRQYTRRSARFGLRGREFFNGVRGGQNRRLALLCLLYRQMTNTYEFPGLTVLDLEQLTGCTREEVTSALWYLCAKHWATLGEFTSYSITAAGFDFVETKLEERLEFRALATIRYYRRQGELESLADAAPRFGKDALPLDIEPAITSERNVSIADHYEILGLGPQADEEAIERVYRTLSNRFHPDNSSTGDARTFLRIREAYDTLSNVSLRSQYDAIRQRSKYSERFRLRGREFFEGIRGEQLRRLAVLCLLYRQAASEAPGLTVLDLEQLTGCTREELGSPLWYLRQKQWAHFGEFTEYSITAAGFDVVENKLEDGETGGSRSWMVSGDSRDHELEYSDVSPTLSSGNGADTPRYLLADAVAVPENGNSHRIVESEPLEEVRIEEVSPAQPLLTNAATAPGIRNLQNAGISPTDIFQHLLQLEKAEEVSAAELVVESQQTKRPENDDVMPQSLIENTVNAPEDQRALTQAPAPVDSGENDRPKRGFMRRLLGFDSDPKPGASSQRIYQLTPDYPPVIASEPTDTIPADTPSESAPAFPPAPEMIAMETVTLADASPSQSAPVFLSVPEIPNPQIPETIPSPSESAPVFLTTPENPNPQIPETIPAAEVALAEAPPSESAPASLTTSEDPNPEFPETIPAEMVTLAEAPPSESVFLTAAENPNPQIPETIPAEMVTLAEAPPSESAPVFLTAPEIPNPQIPETIPAEMVTLAEAPPSESAPVFLTAPEIPDSQVLAMIPAEIKAEASPDEQPALTPSPAQIETHPITPQPLVASIAIAPAIPNRQLAAMIPADIKAEEPPTEPVAHPQAVADPAPPSQSNMDVTPQAPGVIHMRTSTNAIAEHTGGIAVGAAKRVIFSMGGKGGVGKTNVMTGLAEWFDENRIPVTLLDLDTENKACGSLAHFFGGRVPKINIHTPAGLDAFIDHLGADAPVILADMGAGAGYVAHEWFDTMYPDLAETGVVFTAIGVVTPDPASVESVLNWAAALQGRVNYVIVENNLTEHADFTYWRDGVQAQEFQKRYHPAIVRLDNRLAELENAARNYGATLGRVAARSTGAPELQKASLVMRAQSYRRRLFAEFDNVKELLLP